MTMHRTQIRLALSLALLVALALSAACPAAAFAVRAGAREEAPPASSFAQYAAERTARDEAHRAATARGDAPPSTQLTFVHFNDLYELMSSGLLGGAARFATLVRQTEALGKPGHTLSVLAGDLFSPSALSTVNVTGREQGLQGMQMVATMNVMGLNVSALGNHETDVKVEEFADRLIESKFPWLCANAQNYSYTNMQSDPWFASFGVNGSTTDPLVRVGIWSLNLDSNNKIYQSYDNFTDSLSVAAALVEDMTPKVDVNIALTHLPYYHDQTLVETVPGIHIVMGGHEHIAMRLEAPGLPGIYKADSNVRSAWIHDITITPSLARDDPQRVVIYSTLVEVRATELPEDPVVAAEVARWVKLAFAGFEAEGFKPAAYLATPTVDLVGTNDVIFDKATVLTQLFNLALLEEAARYATVPGFKMPPVDGTLFNAGAIRIDDTIAAQTPMTQYDAIRISPYSNAVALVNMTGAVLKQVLDASSAARNTSQFLHGYPNITYAAEGAYLINGHPLDASSDKWYVMGVLRFLLEGGKPYGMLVPKTSAGQVVVLQLDENTDVRRSVLDQIAIMFPSSKPPTPRPGHHTHKVLGLKPWLFGLILAAAGVAIFLFALCYVRAKKNAQMQLQRMRYDDREGDVEWSASTTNAQRRQQALNYNRM